MPNRVKRFDAGGETEEDRRLQDIEDRIMGRSRPYKRGERMLRLLDPTMDPITGERDVKGFARQMVTNVAPPGALQRHNPLMNLLREANRLSKAYHGQDYVKELKERIDQAGTSVDLKDLEPQFKVGGKVGRGDGIAQRGKTKGRFV